MTHPTTDFDGSFSEPGAKATPWLEVVALVDSAEMFWLSTVRRDGRPHVTPLIALWMDDSLYFGTGPEEQKAVNLRDNAHCVLTTGSNRLAKGLDAVFEGEAVRVTDEADLQRVTDAWVAKYGEEWRFAPSGDQMEYRGNAVLMFRLEPKTVIAFSRGPFSQTGYRF